MRTTLMDNGRCSKCGNGHFSTADYRITFKATGENGNRNLPVLAYPEEYDEKDRFDLYCVTCHHQLTGDYAVRKVFDGEVL